MDFEDLPDGILLHIMNYICGSDRSCEWYSHGLFYRDVRNFVVAALVRRIRLLKQHTQFRVMLDEAFEDRLEDSIQAMYDQQWDEHHF